MQMVTDEDIRYTPVKVMEDCSLSGSARLIYSYCWFSFRNGIKAFAISDGLGLSRTTVLESLRELCDAGYMDVKYSRDGIANYTFASVDIELERRDDYILDNSKEAVSKAFVMFERRFGCINFNQATAFTLLVEEVGFLAFSRAFDLAVSKNIPRRSAFNFIVSVARKTAAKQKTVQDMMDEFEYVMKPIEKGEEYYLRDYKRDKQYGKQNYRA